MNHVFQWEDEKEWFFSQNQQNKKGHVLNTFLWTEVRSRTEIAEFGANSTATALAFHKEQWMELGGVLNSVFVDPPKIFVRRLPQVSG